MRLVFVLASMWLFMVQAEARCDDRELVIRLGLAPQSETPARQSALKSLQSAINSELQGRACLQVILDDKLFASALSVTALQSGSVDMTLPSFSELAAVAGDYRVFDLPFAFRDVRAVQRFLTLAGNRMSESLVRFDVTLAAIWNGHFDQISAKRPVVLPADMAGLKVRTQPSSSVSQMIDLLDGIEQSVNREQLAAAIKDGRIDAQVTDWVTLMGNNTAQMHKGVTQTNHTYRGHVLLASRTWWVGLDANLKKSLSELISRISKQANFDADQRQVNAKRTIIRSGVPVRGLTQQQRKDWITTMKPIWDAYENRHLLQLVVQADKAL
ncbi:MAG: hypothetical protein GKR97_06495 [Rhizobiaceae bacterium]|nr:hypothetical protein [Rhizobiaceae bacterium]